MGFQWRGEDKVISYSSTTIIGPTLERANRHQVREHQWGLLESLIEKVFKNNQFYRDKWLDAGVPNWREIDSFGEFLLLPFTTREEFSLDQESNPPYGTNLTWPIEAYTQWHRTSGTKGKPLIVLGTNEDWEAQARTWYHNFNGVGLKPGDSIFIAFSFGPFAGLWGAVAGAQRAGIMMIPGGGLPTLQRIQFIRRHTPTAIVCIPSYAMRMAKVAQENGLDLHEARIRLLIHGGEPGPSIPATRARIENAWNAKSYDSTGLTEVGHHGFECQAQSGVHIIESEFYVEVIEPGGIKSVPDGEVGEMVVTSFSRTGMPVIRYRTGDLIKLTEEPCECGRTFSRLEGGIVGRLDGMITVRGINVYPTTIEDCLMSHPEVGEFHVDIFNRSEMKEIRVLIEAPCDDHASQEVDKLINRIREDLYQRLSLRADVESVAPGSLQRSKGKAKRFTFHN